MSTGGFPSSRPTHRTSSRLWFLLVMACSALTATAIGDGVGDDRALGLRTTTQWEPFLEWLIDVPTAVSGNPYDAEAYVTFAHVDEKASHRTPMFYAGEGRWGFRFTGTRPGRWTFESTSAHAPLAGWRGSVVVEPNPDQQAGGFLLAAGTRFATEIGADRTLVGRLYHVFMDDDAPRFLREFSPDPVRLEQQITGALDQVERNGMDALLVSVYHSWFEYGAMSANDHDSVDPSPTTFAILERLIARAYERGLSIHIWMWGDEERRQTPIRTGGINGDADRRLQRYIAARLGPLPGWTLSYGFDLEEWVTPDQVRVWWSYLQGTMGWPRLIMAREADARAPRLVFDLGDDKLDVYSSDDRPVDQFFASAKTLLSEGARPLLFERRFLHTRDDTWDMNTTRRALWQFTLAGGAGAVWGVLWGGGQPYPAPEQLRTHQRFWRQRAHLDLVRSRQLADPSATIMLADDQGTRAVFYAEATMHVGLALAGMREPITAIAVDTRSAYEEMPITDLIRDQPTWQAPYASDWAVAVGDF